MNSESVKVSQGIIVKQTRPSYLVLVNSHNIGRPSSHNFIRKISSNHVHNLKWWWMITSLTTAQIIDTVTILGKNTRLNSSSRILNYTISLWRGQCDRGQVGKTRKWLMNDTFWRRTRRQSLSHENKLCFSVDKLRESAKILSDLGAALALHSSALRFSLKIKPKN